MRYTKDKTDTSSTADAVPLLPLEKAFEVAQYGVMIKKREE